LIVFLRRRNAGAVTDPPPAAARGALGTGAHRLPGRRDLVIPAARKLCPAADDTSPETFRTVTRMAEAIARRGVPVGALADCLRRATGPAARDAGKVLAASWKRSGARTLARDRPA